MAKTQRDKLFTGIMTRELVTNYAKDKVVEYKEYHATKPASTTRPASLHYTDPGKKQEGRFKDWK